MCGIVAYSGHPTSGHLSILKQVMLESQIRGRHASGIAWIGRQGKGFTVKSTVQPIPMKGLLATLDLRTCVMKDGSAYIVAHTRYSTSDINYNQPIVSSSGTAIVHNGVITQSDYSTWESTYGIRCSGRNDSELLLAALDAELDIEELFAGSSYSYARLSTKEPHLSVARNALRPLWRARLGDGEVYASTYDILYRSGLADISRVQPVFTNQNDLQVRSTSES